MIRTAESITPKHPDKVCDRISDMILTECLKQDPDSRVAIETMGGHGAIIVMGEVSTNAYVPIESKIRVIVGDKYGILQNIVKQSNYISQGVDKGGAGDQGIMVGYACDENEELIPHELYLARNLCKEIYKHYSEDGKTQITLNDNIITHVVASFQNTTKRQLDDIVFKWLKDKPILTDIKIHLNPAGDWSVGGFDADAGVTGRKLACDNYGTRIPIGGGAFSGKDPSKVDRSGAYMARRLAVDYLKKYNAKEVYAYLAYAIGVSEPVQATAIVDGKEIQIKEDCSPKAIIDRLKLKEQDYEEVAKWGSFGNGFIWG